MTEETKPAAANGASDSDIDSRLKKRWAAILGNTPGYKQYEGPVHYSPEERERQLMQRRRDLLKNTPGYKQYTGP